MNLTFFQNFSWHKLNVEVAVIPDESNLITWYILFDARMKTRVTSSLCMERKEKKRKYKL